MNTVEKMTKYAFQQSIEENRNKERCPPTHQDWARHHRGSHLGLASNPPEQGDGEKRSPGVAAPWYGLLATIFYMAVCSWSRVASTSMLGPDLQGRWASLLVSLLCFVRKRIFVTISTVFVYKSCKIIIFQ